jgi:hypothetical protein
MTGTSFLPADTLRIAPPHCFFSGAFFIPVDYCRGRDDHR